MAEYGIIEEIVDYLVTQSIGTKGADLFANYVPPATTHPDVVSVLEQSGTPTIHSSVVSDFRVQAIVRSGSLKDGRIKAKDVHNALHNKSIPLATSTITFSRNSNFPPIYFKNPNTEKHEFSMNFVMTIKEVFA